MHATEVYCELGLVTTGKSAQADLPMMIYLCAKVIGMMELMSSAVSTNTLLGVLTAHLMTADPFQYALIA